MSVDHKGGTANLPLVTRVQARASGLTRFFTGQRCKYGHLAERRVSSNRCVECHTEYRWSTKGIATINQYRSTPERRVKNLFKNACLSSIKRRHPPPTITWQDLMPALERGTCDLTGIPFDLSAGQGKGRLPYAPSIDRPNISEPYTKENFRVVLWAINIGCSTWGYETYLKIARAIK